MYDTGQFFELLSENALSAECVQDDVHTCGDATLLAPSM
jgi:hypothetical protein